MNIFLALNLKVCSQCNNLKSVDLSKISFEMKYSYDLKEMFNECINLKYVNMKINTFYVSNTNRMFYNCISLVSADLSKLNTIYLETADYMFYNCTLLKSINLNELKSVTNINFMFYNCISLDSIDFSSFYPDKLE